MSKSNNTEANEGNLVADHVETLERMLAAQRKQLQPWLDGSARVCTRWTAADTKEAIRAYEARIAALECAIAALKEAGRG